MTYINMQIFLKRLKTQMLLKHEDMLFNNGGGGESNGISPLHKQSTAREHRRLNSRPPALKIL